jgi:hypothetical protein
LDQNVELDAMLIHCAPEQVRFATKRNEHLVEVPYATRLASRRFHRAYKTLTKLVAPAPGGLVYYDDPAPEEQFLDVTQTQLGAVIPTHRATDDRRRKTVTVVELF